MVRFSHIADCHLGSWREPALQALNLESFRKSIETSILEKVDFVIIAGDLFDSAYPPIEILKEAFHILSTLKKTGIPCYIIAGSHDYSVSGKTFLDVLEKAGFCVNVHKQEIESDGKIILFPTIYNNSFALYGYPGRKSGMEVADVRKIKLAPSNFQKVLLLHTTLEFVKGNLPIEAVEESQLPAVDYCALGHIHVVQRKNQFIYPGPTFPNNFQELADLHHGGFYIVNLEKEIQLRRYDFPLKKVVKIDLLIENAITATDKIINEIRSQPLEDAIVLLKLHGIIHTGKTSDIKFSAIEKELENKKAYCFLKNTSDLQAFQSEITIQIDKMENVEEKILENYIKEKSTIFNKIIVPLIHALSIEKKEDEKSIIFEQRLTDEIKTIFSW